MRSLTTLFASAFLLAALPAPATAQQHHLVLHVAHAHGKVDLTVSGVQPGMPVVLFGGTKLGHTLVVRGGPGIHPLTVGLAQPFTIVLLGVADAHGQLKLSAPFSGKLPLMQAVSPAKLQIHHRTVIGWLLSRVIGPHG